MARQIASFSSGQVGWFVLLLAASLALVSMFAYGYFRPSGARTGMWLLGGLLLLDLSIANRDWVVVWDYETKYSSNPVVDFLRAEPYEHRVAMTSSSTFRDTKIFDQIYNAEWAQHPFPYNDIETLEIVQLARVPADIDAFAHAFAVAGGTMDDVWKRPRRWQLTNTRYILGDIRLLSMFNNIYDPEFHRFKVVMPFDIIPRKGVIRPEAVGDFTAIGNPAGRLAVFEFGGALPRAALFDHWQVASNDDGMLNTITDRAFDPLKQVVVATNAPPPQADAAATPSAPCVPAKITRYSSQDVEIEASPAKPSILMLNDRFDATWKVLVDGVEGRIFRCNYLMRGVYLQPGAHKVEFRFAPSNRALYVSLGGLALGAVLAIALLISSRRKTV